MNRGSTNRTLSAHQFGKKNFDVTERAVTHLDPISGLIEQLNVLFYFLAHWVLRFKLHCHAFHFSWKVTPPRGTWLRIKNAPLIESKERGEKEKRDREKSPAPTGSGNQTWDLSIRSPMRYHLSYHHGPVTCYLKTKLRVGISSIF